MWLFLMASWHGVETMPEDDTDRPKIKALEHGMTGCWTAPHRPELGAICRFGCGGLSRSICKPDIPIVNPAVQRLPLGHAKELCHSGCLLPRVLSAQVTSSPERLLPGAMWWAWLESLQPHLLPTGSGSEL